MSLRCQFCPGAKITRQPLGKGFIGYDCLECAGHWEAYFDPVLEFETLVNYDQWRRPSKIKPVKKAPKKRQYSFPRRSKIQKDLFPGVQLPPEQIRARLGRLKKTNKFDRDPVKRLAELDQWTVGQEVLARKLVHKYRRQL